MTPNSSQPIHLQRDFEKEVKNGGIRTLKTDDAWVGAGYSFGLNGIHSAYNIIGETGERANSVTLDWLGRYTAFWWYLDRRSNWWQLRIYLFPYSNIYWSELNW